MAGAEGNRGKLYLSWPMNGVSRDPRHEFMNQSRIPNENEQNEAQGDEEIELNLGLSMNGRFGVDPARKKLRRSSSVSNLVLPEGSFDNGSSSRHRARGVAGEGYAPLARACSLPTETDEWRRRKELQSMRCMEARKKRMEKLKNVRVRDRENSSDDAHNGSGSQSQSNEGVNVQTMESGILNGFQNWNLMPSSQGSIGSSSASDLQNQLIDGANGTSTTNSSSSLPILPEQTIQIHGVKGAESDPNRDTKLQKSTLLDMPYVSTRGYGPNCRKTEGFLYRYKRGDDVKIVCVCHGMFLSPAEFVKHGGGGDVAQPLKHIVVNPFPLF
ncbi:Ninja-family protein AFP3 [Sesamum alatum]|uniref:Ninja-family protein n=1 Tax=Sesamum alatum TaxID=300844 RepID=A0AAE1YA11_9LAMI|nr:Ninja-family protein AFP3 [Sesamum alatum]